MERIRCKDEETTAAAMQLSKIDAAQEEGVLEQKSEKKSTPTKILQREMSSKKSLPKN